MTDRIPADISSGEAFDSTTTSAETRTLRDVMQSSKRSGGNYGSLAKSKVQAIFYISHKIESDDTLQRLALKYSINLQEIKRVNKLWSDAELGLLEYVYIPVDSMQLSTLRTIYPTLEAVQNPPTLTNHPQKPSTNATSNDETASSIRSSDSSTSISTTNNSSFQDYFSKIDQQIQLTKKSLQSLDIKEQYSNSQSSEISTSNTSNNDDDDDTNTSENNRPIIKDKVRHKGAHHLSDNSAFVNISPKNPRDKHVSAALQRLQDEKDNFDEL